MATLQLFIQAVESYKKEPYTDQYAVLKRIAEDFARKAGNKEVVNNILAKNKLEMRL